MPNDLGGPRRAQYDYHMTANYTGVDPNVLGYKFQNPDPVPNGKNTVGGVMTGATAATAGTPGTFTGSPAPANAAAATNAGVTASPATAWTTGQYVQGTIAGVPGQMHWTGTAWASGPA